MKPSTELPSSTIEITEPTPRGGRVHLVDLLRLLALLQMVNGHTLDAIVEPSALHGSGFDVYNFFRGLVSVSFMLASGIAFHLTTISRLDRGALDPAATRKRVFRMIEIIVIGYLLRFPLGGWVADAEHARRSWDRFAEIDVLQLIGASLLALEVLAHALRDRRKVVLAAGGLGVLVLALSPITEGVVAERPLAYLTAWLGHGSGSIFPFFPWSAYVMFGAVLGALAFPEGGRTASRHTFFALARLTLAASACSFVLWRVPFTLWQPSMSYHSMPAFFVEKLAWVLGILTLLHPLVSRIRRLPEPVAELAQETLPIYVFHLLALFFPPLALAARLGHHVTLAEGLGVSACMIAASVVVGLAWPRVSPFARRRKPKQGAAKKAAPLPAAEAAETSSR